MRLRTLLAACCLPAAFAPPPAAAAHYGVTSKCTYAYKSVAGSTSHVLVAVVVEAHATGETPALTTTATCVVRNSYREQFTTTGVVPGPNAYWSGSAIFRWDTPEVCSESSATFIAPNGSTFRVVEEQRCTPGG